MKTNTYVISRVIAAVNELKNFNLKPEDSFHYYDLKDEMVKQLKRYDEIRIKTCKEYGIYDEKTKRYIIAKDKQEEFNKQITELMNCEVELTHDIITKQQFIDMVSASPKNILSGKLTDALKGFIWDVEKAPVKKEKPAKKKKEK